MSWRSLETKTKVTRLHLPFSDVFFTTVSHAHTAEPIDVLFGVYCRFVWAIIMNHS